MTIVRTHGMTDLTLWLVHTSGHDDSRTAVARPADADEIVAALARPVVFDEYEPPDLMPPLPIWHPASPKRVGSRNPAMGAEATKREARKREKTARRRQRGLR